jgi:hypothetical protein
VTSKFVTSPMSLRLKVIATLCGLWLCAGVAPFSWGHTLSKNSGQGLVVGRITLDPLTSSVDVELINQSSTSLAAYGLAVVTKYANGKEFRSVNITDISHRIVSSRILSAGGNLGPSSKPQLLTPGGHIHHRTLAAPGEGGSPVVSVQAFVISEMFADGSAEGRENDVRQLRAVWQKELDETRLWLPALIRLRLSKTTTADMQELLTKLDLVDKSWQGPPDVRSAVRRDIRQKLQFVIEPGTRGLPEAAADVNRVIELTEARATLLAHLLREDRKGDGQ